MAAPPPDNYQPRHLPPLPPPPPPPLSGSKVAMITGASSGIGHQLCLYLSNSGFRIIAAARRIDRLTSLCRQINGDGDGDIRAVAVELDVTADGSQIDVAVKKAWDEFGRIDALVNNAGVRGEVHSPLDISEEEWNYVLKTNLTGLWLVSKSVGIRMRHAKIQGSIINVTSTAGLNRGHLPGSVAYSTSKAAANTLTKMMALELGAYNIRVNAIAPGIFKSQITEKLVNKKWFKEVSDKIVPLKMHGTTDPALTSLVRYLIDDASQYVTGNIFIVDAGFTLPSIPIFSSL